jgi:hypothetical protein
VSLVNQSVRVELSGVELVGELVSYFNNCWGLVVVSCCEKLVAEARDS